MVVPGLPARIRNARFFQAIVIYLAGFWVIMRALGVLERRLDLAPWTVPAVVVALLLGLIVVLVKAGAIPPERPADGRRWRIDPGRVLAIGVAMIAVFLGALAVIILVYGSGGP